jgi:hypothetical protein
VDVRDTARLHVAALVEHDVQNERIFAFSEPFNFHDIFNIIERLRPGHSLPENLAVNERDLMKVEERPRSEELLQRMGMVGFISLEDSVAATLKGL